MHLGTEPGVDEITQFAHEFMAELGVVVDHRRSDERTEDAGAVEPPEQPVAHRGVGHAGVDDVEHAVDRTAVFGGDHPAIARIATGSDAAQVVVAGVVGEDRDRLRVDVRLHDEDLVLERHRTLGMADVVLDQHRAAEHLVRRQCLTSQGDFS